MKNEFITDEVRIMNQSERDAWAVGFRRCLWLFSVNRDGVEVIGSHERRRLDVQVHLEQELLALPDRDLEKA